jgi:hypothetical protein
MCFLVALLEVWCIATAFEGLEYSFVPAYFG